MRNTDCYHVCLCSSTIYQSKQLHNDKYRNDMRIIWHNYFSISKSVGASCCWQQIFITSKVSYIQIISMLPTALKTFLIGLYGLCPRPA